MEDRLFEAHRGTRMRATLRSLLIGISGLLFLALFFSACSDDKSKTRLRRHTRYRRHSHPENSSCTVSRRWKRAGLFDGYGEVLGGRRIGTGLFYRGTGRENVDISI